MTSGYFTAFSLHAIDAGYIVKNPVIATNLNAELEDASPSHLTK